MPTVAEQLRAAREAQNLSISRVAEATNIKSDYLRALEAGRLETFSAPIYVKGFVRTYASHLRLKVPELIAQLEGELAQSKKFAEPPPLGDGSKNPLDFLALQFSKLNWRTAVPIVVALAWIAASMLAGGAASSLRALGGAVVGTVGAGALLAPKPHGLALGDLLGQGLDVLDDHGGGFGGATAAADLDRLLTDLARNGTDALLEQRRGVGACRPRQRARGDRPPECRLEAGDQRCANVTAGGRNSWNRRTPSASTRSRVPTCRSTVPGTAVPCGRGIRGHSLMCSRTAKPPAPIAAPVTASPANGPRVTTERRPGRTGSAVKVLVPADSANGSSPKRWPRCRVLDSRSIVR